MPPSRTLYDLSYRFALNQPWLKIKSDEPFFITFRDGAHGLVNIIGTGQRKLGYNVFLGDEALERYLATYKGVDSPSTFGRFQNIVRKGGIQMAFEDQDKVPFDLRMLNREYGQVGIRVNKVVCYPNFKRFEPFKRPELLKDDKGLSYLEQAGLAIAYLSKRIAKEAPEELGFKEVQDDDFSELELPSLKVSGKGLDDVELGTTEIGKSKIQEEFPEPEFKLSESLAAFDAPDLDHGVEARVIFYPTPKTRAGEPEEIYTTALVVMDEQTGETLVVPTKSLDEVGPMFFNILLVKLYTILGKPSKLSVADRRTYSLLKSFCSEVGLPLEMAEETKHLREAEERVFEALTLSELDDETLDSM